jgi:Flp pilus assembly protein TadD
VLLRAERCFFESLFVDPLDFEALNGLGSILYFEREYEAAEFFIRRALALAKHAGVDYPAAKSDLQLVLRARRKD